MSTKLTRNTSLHTKLCYPFYQILKYKEQIAKYYFTITFMSEAQKKGFPWGQSQSTWRATWYVIDQQSAQQ